MGVRVNNRQANELRLNVRYKGIDVQRGRMSALDLGPAILGVGQMVGRASRALYGDEARVRVDVRADFEHASFGIEFYAVSAVDGLLPALTLDQLAQLATILGFSGGVAAGGIKGLVWLFRQLRGQEIQKVEIHGDVTVIHVEGDSYEISVQEYKALKDPKVREGFKGLVEPMESEGVDEVEVGVEDKEPVRIQRDERRYFDVPSLPEEEISTDVSRRVVEVVAPTFREENKWRFAEGEATYFAEIVDDRFLDKVNRHDITFGKGDALMVEMETRTSRIDEQLTYDRKILEVLKHIKPSEGSQIDLLAGND